MNTLDSANLAQAIYTPRAVGATVVAATPLQESDQSEPMADPTDIFKEDPQDLQGESGQEEDEYIPDEVDIFAPEVGQKKLPPLSHKEKIVWAFRLAETNTFL